LPNDSTGGRGLSGNRKDVARPTRLYYPFGAIRGGAAIAPYGPGSVTAIKSPTPALSGAGGFIARVRSNSLLGEYIGRETWFKRRVGRRLFACPPIMPNPAWADDKAVCPPYLALESVRTMKPCAAYITWEGLMF
jgi:hypothetical protein